MNFGFTARIGAIAAALALASCAHIENAPQPPAAGTVSTPIATSRYDVVPGREASVVARLRAAPPPAQPELSEGKTRDGDERLLRAQGYVQIGIGTFPARNTDDLREQALKKAIEVGADKVLIYPSSLNNGASNPVDASPPTAICYVRLRLPFGANFRDLTEQEHQTLGVDGVEIGEVVGGTPAAEANLRDGDFVLKLNRKPVQNKATFQALLQAHMGLRVTLAIRRDGVTFDRLVRLGTLPVETGK